MKTVSDLLRDRRTELGISISKVSKDTKIPVEHIESIERADWRQFASFAFAQGVLRKYANYLRIDAKKISALLRRELVQSETNFILNTSYKEKKIIATRQLVFFGFLFVFTGYFIFQLLMFIRTPALKLQDIPSSIRKSEPLEIRGVAEQGALIYLNDERIFQNSNGSFEEQLYLKKGTRTLKLKVIGTNGTIVEKSIVVQVKD